MELRINLQETETRRPSCFLRGIIQSFFFSLGIIALGYCAFVLVDATAYQNYQSRRFQQALTEKRSLSGGAENNRIPSVPALPPPNASSATVGSVASPKAAGPVLGQISISAIGLSAMISEGTDYRTLGHAVGHVLGTAEPGELGNAAIAGHRDTFFRALRNIHQNDEITLTTLDGSYRYQVDLIEVVEPNDTEALDDSQEARLTLITCYPFSFIGPAPKRFIVGAHIVSK